jgi:hypothetical protein
MPITTESELRSAAQWYPAPPNHQAVDLLDEEADWQDVSWTYRGLTLQAVIALAYAVGFHRSPVRTIRSGVTRPVHVIEATSP